MKFINITIQVPRKDILIINPWVDHEDESIDSPGFTEVEFECIEIDGLKYEIIDYDEDKIKELAFENAEAKR